MTKKYFTTDNQLEEWIKGAKNVEANFGTQKALGYLIGEKFYGLFNQINSKKRCIQFIEKQKEKPDYNPIFVTTVSDHTYKNNLDDEYEKQKALIALIKKIIAEFSTMIKESFKQYEIKKYFNTNPRLGVLGHICTEEQHAFMVENNAVEHSIDTEIEDALIFGEMKKHVIDTH